jgi:hypothetical protein
MEQVVVRLVVAREAAQPVGHSQRVEPVATPGQDLVDVRLVRNVERDAIPVLGDVEDVVQRDGQLDHTQIAGEMTAGALHALDQKLADLGAECFQIGARQTLEVFGVVDRREDVHQRVRLTAISARAVRSSGEGTTANAAIALSAHARA